MQESLLSCWILSRSMTLGSLLSCLSRLARVRSWRPTLVMEVSGSVGAWSSGSSRSSKSVELVCHREVGIHPGSTGEVLEVGEGRAGRCREKKRGFDDVRCWSSGAEDACSGDFLRKSSI